MRAGDPHGALAAILEVRLASHELMRVCTAVVGGTEMAICETTIDTVGKTTRGLSPMALGKATHQSRE